MDKLKIFSRRISITSLSELIEEIIGKGISFNYLIVDPIIVQRDDETFFKRFHVDEMATYDLPGLYSGRIFSEDTEIRWRRNGNEFIVTVISESDKIILGNKFFSLKDIEDISEYKTKYNSYFLWGEYLQDNKWYEGRIPRILAYPIDVTPRYVQLKDVEYQKDGLTQFIRFVKLEG